MRSFIVDVCVASCGVFQNFVVYVHMERFIGGLWFELQLQDVMFCIFRLCCYSYIWRWQCCVPHYVIQAWIEIFAYFKCG